MGINFRFFIVSVQLALCLLLSGRLFAQVTDYDEDRRGAVYIGLGQTLMSSYNSSTIHISQGSLGNSYDIMSANATGMGSGTGKGFPMNMDFRVGFYCNYNQTVGVEINYSPGKYFVNDGQTVQIKGTVDNAPYNNKLVFSGGNGFKYNYNGAGLMLFNFVRRIGVYRGLDHLWAFDLVPKIGVGPVLSRVQANLFGVNDKPSSKISGWNAGFEIAGRATFNHYFYGEVAYRYDQVNETNVTIPSGTATQKFNAKAVVLSLGIMFPTTKRNPMFSKGVKKKRVPLGPQPMYKNDKNGFK